MDKSSNDSFSNFLKSDEAEDKRYEEIAEKWLPEREDFPQGVEENKETKEKKELTDQEREERRKLIEEIKKTSISSAQDEEEAEKEAESISTLSAKAKIKHLLALAQTKGVFFAVNVAKKLNDAYLLDIFHDILIKEKIFRKFLK